MDFLMSMGTEPMRIRTDRGMVSTGLEHPDQSSQVAQIRPGPKPYTRAGGKDELQKFSARCRLPRLRRGAYRANRKQAQALFWSQPRRRFFRFGLREGRGFCFFAKLIEPIAQAVNANAPFLSELWL